MLSPKSRERRYSPRYPLVRLAKFQPADGGPKATCLAIELSSGGIRLSGLGTPIPDEFVLTLTSDGPSYDGTYKVIWRNGSEVGAKLTKPATPDA
jgi:hypothetical protein